MLHLSLALSSLQLTTGAPGCILSIKLLEQDSHALRSYPRSEGLASSQIKLCEALTKSTFDCCGDCADIIRPCDKGRHRSHPTRVQFTPKSSIARSLTSSPSIKINWMLKVKGSGTDKRQPEDQHSILSTDQKLNDIGITWSSSRRSKSQNFRHPNEEQHKLSQL